MEFRTIQGSAHDIPIPDKSVQLVVTSPPYYSLRKYNGEQEIDWQEMSYSPMPGLPPITIPAQRAALGLESDPFAYIGHLILCLREWHRILRDDGLVFCNLGDSYAGSGGAHAPGHVNPGISKSATRNGHERPAKVALPAKSLMQIPQRFALAAQADGWYLRSAIVWAKGLSFLPDYAGSCMPESVGDRPTQSYEMVYMLAKSARYYSDMESVREQYQESSLQRYKSPFNGKDNPSSHATNNPSVQATGHVAPNPAGRQLRSVWAISPSGFGAAHFACFPERLVEPMIKMGTSSKGCCPACSAPYRRVVEREGNPRAGRGRFDSDYRNNTNGAQPQRAGSGSGALTPKIITAGWQPTCTCPDAGEPQPCVVLDPFSGSGTTLKVAVKLGRRAIGVDLSEKYLTEITDARMGAGVQMELTW